MRLALAHLLLLPAILLVAALPPAAPSQAPRSLNCQDDLRGFGSLSTTCTVEETVDLELDAVIEGRGNLTLKPSVSLNCSVPDCELRLILGGALYLGKGASILAGVLVVEAHTAYVGEGAYVSARGLGGEPPPQTSGTPTTVDGSGAGHGGRGANCSAREASDVWGGDGYAWSTLDKPWKCGSRGGGLGNEEGGGAGGGRVNVTVHGTLYLHGVIDADGAVAQDGGGGSGGSVVVKAATMQVSFVLLIGTTCLQTDGSPEGRISANGGAGHAGGGGGRVAYDCADLSGGFQIKAHGGDSEHCPENAGAAGTIFDISAQALTISNSGYSTSTATELFDFRQYPLWVHFHLQGNAKVVVLSPWSRVQVSSTIVLGGGGELLFGSVERESTELELMAQAIRMEDSSMHLFSGGLKIQVMRLSLTTSQIHIRRGISVLDSDHLQLKGGSRITSGSILAMVGQGVLELGDGDLIGAERLFLSLYIRVQVGYGGRLVAPLEVPYSSQMKDLLYCDTTSCPHAIVDSPEDCYQMLQSPFTLQMCRVEEVIVFGNIHGSIVHIQRSKTISIGYRGELSSSALGKVVQESRELEEDRAAGREPAAEQGMGAEEALDLSMEARPRVGTLMGALICPASWALALVLAWLAKAMLEGVSWVMLGSKAYPVMLEVDGTVSADGQGAIANTQERRLSGRRVVAESGDWQQERGGAGGGSGGSLLLFMHHLQLGEDGVISSVGGAGDQVGGGGGGGGRIYFYWENSAIGEAYVERANVSGRITTSGGVGSPGGGRGDAGTLHTADCPPGLAGVFCQECPLGTYKDEHGAAPALCKPCSTAMLPHHAYFVQVRGGVPSLPCPYQCVSSRYSLPHCNTMLEDLIATFGGPWLFTIISTLVLLMLALTLSVARMKLVGSDEFTAPSPHHPDTGSLIDHSFPFLESLNEVMEATRVEESAGHVYRIHLMGCNAFLEPFHLPHTPPDAIADLVYEDAYNRFAEDVNALAAFQWWEGCVYGVLIVLSLPLAYTWQQWSRRHKVKRLRDFVHTEYDHSCLRSCRSRALYEGLKVSATPDLTLAYIDVFLGGDEKRSDLPPSLKDRLPMALVFAGDASYMAPYQLHSDNLLTSLLGQEVPATLWYRFVGGLNVHLRTVRRGGLLCSTLEPVIAWLSSHAMPTLGLHGLQLSLAWFQATASGYYQLGLLLSKVESVDSGNSSPAGFRSKPNVVKMPLLEHQWPHTLHPHAVRRRMGGGIIDSGNVRQLEDTRDVTFLLGWLLANTLPLGHDAMVGLAMSLLLVADMCLSFLTLLQFYSISLEAFLCVLLILPLTPLVSAAAGLNALFSLAPKRAAGLSRLYGLWNATSLVNALVALIYGFAEHESNKSTGKSSPGLVLPGPEHGWGWCLLPALLIACKCLQARTIDCHVANLEVQDRTLLSADQREFWDG
eukprot:SM000328S12470  [mRNA]  locus=s328:66061:75568:- [translate_table: standard]